MKTLLVISCLLLGCCIASAQRYTYDNAGRITSATYKNGVQIQYTYDANGNITNKKNSIVNSVTEEKSILVEPLILFPNPASDKLCVTLPENIKGAEIQLEILDATGKLLTTMKYLAKEFSGEVSLKGNPSGVYTLRVTTTHELYVGRCIVQ